MMEICAQREGDLLRLTVRDNGPGLAGRRHTDSSGIGLNNLRERLRLAYGAEASIDLVDHGYAGEIVFITAYEQHAVRAFEHRAVDYLVKPLDDMRLRDTIAPAGAPRPCTKRRDWPGSHAE